MTEHVGDLLPEYVLDLLDEEERRQVEDHLSSCADCSSRAAETEDTAGKLPLALRPIDPPPALRSRVMAAAAQTSEHPSRAAVQTPPPPIQLRPRPRSWTGPRVMALVAAAAVILFVVGVSLGRELQRPKTSAMASYRQLVGTSVLHGDRIRSFPTGSVGAHVALAVSPHGASSLIVGPTRPAGAQRVYQLWFIHGRRPPVSAGIFLGGSVAHRMSLARSVSGFQTAAVTVEPGPRGSRQPTTKPILATSVAHL